MLSTFRKVIKNIPRAIKDPGWALVVSTRFLPFPIFSKDPEAARIGSWAFGKLPRIPIRDLLPGIEATEVTLMRIYDREIGTSIDPQEILVLASVVKHSGAKRILEIGTNDGNTALNLAANSAPDAMITTVDLPPDWDQHYELQVPDSYVNVTDRARVGVQFHGTPCERKIKQVFGDSAKIEWNDLAPPFDLVFIDGNHYLSYVQKDTENALRHLQNGGIVIWHDYGSIKDVSTVVDETAKSMRVAAIRGTRMAIGFKA